VLIVYSRKYEQRYPANPVENPDRVRLPAVELQKLGYMFMEPKPCSLAQIGKVHGREHIDRVRQSGHFDATSLAAGGAIAAANRAWGMCYFNNMAIAIKNIRPRAKKALIIDIDLHYGDGTVSIFRGDSNVKIVNPWSVDENFEYLNMDGSRYLSQVKDAFLNFDYDIVGVSAGFDTYLGDWGRLLKKEDYLKIGKAIRNGSERCSGHRFAVLEGGYHPDLKWCIKSFIEGFERG
jgi:acetoin utilization deacetylase AcuC-like enzyme